MTARILRAPWLLPGDDTPIRDAAVVLDSRGRVLSVGAASEIVPANAGLAIESHDAIIGPGLINAHTHVELSWMRGMLPPGHGFVPWVTALVALRRGEDPDSVSAAIDAACDELVSAGTAAVGDVSNRGETGEPLARRGIGGWCFHEITATERDGGASALAAMRDGLSHAPAMPPMRATLAPHALYSVGSEIIRAAWVHAQRESTPLSIHLAEHAAERAFVRDRTGPLVPLLASAGFDLDASPRGESPIAAAVALGIVDARLLAVHLADTRRAELDILATHHARAVLCPRSNLFIQTLLPPLLDILAAGLRPALGTDSLASNTSLDVLAEAAALHARFPTVATRMLFAMATAWGAEALALRALGSIAVGRTPGVVAFDLDPAIAARAGFDPFAHVIKSAPRSRRWLARPFDPTHRSPA